MEVSDQLHAPASSLLKEPWYPMNRRLRRPQFRSRPIGELKNLFLVLWDSNPRSSNLVNIPTVQSHPIDRSSGNNELEGIRTYVFVP